MILVDRCENWGFALRGGLLRGETPSLEGNYRAPKITAALGAPTTRSGINLPDAQIIEAAVCGSVDLYHHAILRAWHVYRLSEPVALRRAAKAAGVERGKVSGFELTLQMAYGILGAALLLPAVVHKARARERVERALAWSADEMSEAA